MDKTIITQSTLARRRRTALRGSRWTFLAISLATLAALTAARASATPTPDGSPILRSERQLSAPTPIR